MVSTVGALEGIGRPISNCTDLLIVDLLDTKTRCDWEGSLGRAADPPTNDELRDFLQEQLMIHEALRSSKSDMTAEKSSHHAKKRGPSSNCSCPACKQEHFVMNCEKYRQRSAKERLELVEAHRLCTNCLGRYPLSECQSSKTCAKCAARHNTTLHEAFPATSGSGTARCASSSECAAVLLACLGDRSIRRSPRGSLVD